MPFPLNRHLLFATIVACLVHSQVHAQSPQTEPGEAVDVHLDEPVQHVPLRICLVAPFTGGYGHLGARVARAVTGPLSTISGAEIRRFDTRGNPGEAREAVRQADEAGCRLLMGGIGDREAIAVADEAERAGIPTLLLGQARDDVRRRYVIWALTTRNDRMDLLARHLLESDITQAFVIPSSGSFGTAESMAFRRSFEAVDGRVAVLPEIDEEEATWKAAAQSLAARRKISGRAGCEQAAVLVVADLAWSRGILGYLVSEGLMSPVRDCPGLLPLGTSAWNDHASLARSGAALNGSRFVDLDARGEIGASEVFDLETSDAAALVVAAISDEHPADRNGILAALQRVVNVPGRTGDLSIEGDRVAGRHLVVWTVDGGRVEALQPSPPAE